MRQTQAFLGTGQVRKQIKRPVEARSRERQEQHIPAPPLPVLGMQPLLLPGDLSQGRAGPRDCCHRFSAPFASPRNLY